MSCRHPLLVPACFRSKTGPLHYSHTWYPSASGRVKPCARCTWTRKNVSALGTCSGLAALARTCMSYAAAPRENTLHRPVLVDFGTRHEL